LKTAFRLLLLAFLSLAASSLGFSRVAENHTNEKSLYSVALFASLEKMQTDWGRYHDYRHAVVEEDRAITDDLPTILGDFSVEYLDDNALRAHRQDRVKDFQVLKIFPIKTIDDGLRINISVYEIGVKKRMVMFGLSEWSNVTFRYDCEKKEFVVADVKLGGI
jgi:hypothetical protein